MTAVKVSFKHSVSVLTFLSSIADNKNEVERGSVTLAEFALRSCWVIVPETGKESTRGKTWVCLSLRRRSGERREVT